MTVDTDWRIRPLKSDFGVDIDNVDVTTADRAGLRGIADALFRHGAVVLRNQRLDQAAQIRFTRFFGEPAENARLEFTDPDFPEIYLISNKIVGDRAIGDPEAGFGWHTDYTYGKQPALCTILYALEVPDEGSDTLLADLQAAWNALPKEKQDSLRGRIIHHSWAQLMRKHGRTATPEQLAALPDVFHPMVRIVPETGQTSLWIAKGTAHEVVGMPNPQGLDLIQELVDFATQERFVYRHKWRVGDLLFWDNRRALHTGTPFDMKKYTRHIRRTWVRGETPVPA
jgi:taurine dioxygenase